MSSKLKEYHHVFDTLDFYPRVHYFLERYRRVLRKFRKLLGNTPHAKLFDSQTLLQNLEESFNYFEAPLEVTVIGRTDLDVKHLVICETTSEDTRKKSNLKGKQSLSRTGKGIHIVICHVIIDDFEEKTIKKTVKTISAAEAARAVPSGNGAFLVYCQFSKKKLVLDEKRGLFRKEVIQGLYEKTGRDINDDNFITDADTITVSSRISLLLETQIVENLHLMKRDLLNFTRPTQRAKGEYGDILERKEFLSIIQGFLRNGLGFVDMLEDTGDKTFKELVFNKLGRIVRCSVVDLIAAKYSLSQDLCNQIAHEVNFEDEMKKCISKNTTYHLSKLEQPCKDYAAAVKSGNTYFVFQGFRFAFIAYQIRDDIKKALEAFEMSICDIVTFTNKICRTAITIDGYLGQSEAGVRYLSNIPEIPQELRKEILRLDGVYGMGTIYGVIVVHLQKLSDEENVKEKLKEVMKQNRFSHPYHTGIVIEEPVYLAIKHGDQVKLSDPPAEQIVMPGTLGCFLDDTEGNLWAFTGAHVVRAIDNNEHNVLYIGAEEQHDTFARSNPDMIYPPGHQPDLIDIAAVKVKTELTPRCSKRLKDDNGAERNWKLFAGNRNAILHREIYKYGATTRFTKGFIASVDYSLSDPRDNNQLLYLIDSADDQEDGALSYATQGDSGAVNCLSDIENTTPIVAVSMVSRGGLNVSEGKFCLTFGLKEGLHKLPMTFQYETHEI